MWGDVGKYESSNVWLFITIYNYLVIFDSTKNATFCDGNEDTCMWKFVFSPLKNVTCIDKEYIATTECNSQLWEQHHSKEYAPNIMLYNQHAIHIHTHKALNCMYKCINNKYSKNNLYIHVKDNLASIEHAHRYWKHVVSLHRTYILLQPIQSRNTTTPNPHLVIPKPPPYRLVAFFERAWDAKRRRAWKLVQVLRELHWPLSREAEREGVLEHSLGSADG